MRRKLAREMAMKLIFQMDIQGDFSDSIIDNFIEELPDDDSQIKYIKGIVKIFIENRDHVDGLIQDNAKEWKLNRIAKIDLSILRVAVVELLYMEDIPMSVSINEAVELGKTFSTEESGSFINGVLGSVIEKK